MYYVCMRYLVFLHPYFPHIFLDAYDLKVQKGEELEKFKSCCRHHVPKILYLYQGCNFLSKSKEDMWNCVMLTFLRLMLFWSVELWKVTINNNRSFPPLFDRLSVELVIWLV